jgi:hypothetical protein
MAATLFASGARLAVLLGGLAFDPHIRGVLIILTAVAILCGSIFLILLTNVGHRLGFLVAFGGLMAWMTILGLTWTLTPPAIGPRGQPPHWQVVDIVYGDPVNSDEEVVHDLGNTCWSRLSRDCAPIDDHETEAAKLLAANPKWVDEAGEDATLSEILNVEPDAADHLDFGEWHLVSAAESGEAVSAADEQLKAEEIFTDSSEYLVLDSWEQGGKSNLPDNPNRWDRISHKIVTTLQIHDPAHYAVVQVIPVIPQETKPGQAPPTPEPDPEQPVITVVMVRDLGNLRVPGLLVTLASGLMFGVTCYMLHRRDKLATEHRAEG